MCTHVIAASKYDKVIEKSEDHFKVRKKSDLREGSLQSEDCSSMPSIMQQRLEFSDLKEQMIRDRLVVAYRSLNVSRWKLTSHLRRQKD